MVMMEVVAVGVVVGSGGGSRGGEDGGSAFLALDFVLMRFAS